MMERFCLPMILLVFSLFSGSVSGQRSGTAERRLELSGFALLGDTYTGLGGYGFHSGLGGRNVSFTAGIDLGFAHRSIYVFSGEARGSYPVLSGQVDGQRDLLAGLRIDARFLGGRFSRVRPYIDVLGGVGQENYVGGYPYGALDYLQSSTAVAAVGAGVEIEATKHFALKADAQFQHWSVPVTMRGEIDTKQGSVGFVYRFGAGERPR